MAGDHSMFTSKYILLRFFMFTAAAGKLVLNGKWIKHFYLLLVSKYRHVHIQIFTHAQIEIKEDSEAAIERYACIYSTVLSDFVHQIQKLRRLKNFTYVQCTCNE